MPLIKSKSRAAVGKNIEREEAAGKPRAQAIAIALDTQRRAGGRIAPKPKTEIERKAPADHKRHQSLY